MQRAAQAAAKKGLVPIDPAGVYFTHARIRPMFSGCNRPVKQTLEDILAGRLEVDDLP